MPVRRWAFVVALLSAALVSAQTVPSQSHYAWSIAGPDLATVSAYVYKATVDASGSAVQVVADTFAGGDAPTLGTNWTRQASGDLGVVNHQARYNGGLSGHLQYGYTGVSWTNAADQYAEAKIVGFQSLYEMAVMVRGSGVGTDASARGYLFIINDDNAASSFGTMSVGLWSFGGSRPATSSVSTTVAANDVIRIEVLGTAITGKINGVTVVTGTDAFLSSGTPGLFIDGPGTTEIWDDFAAGTLSPPVTVLSGVVCAVDPNQSITAICTAPLPNYAPGAHTATLTATNAGGESAASLPVTFTISDVSTPSIRDNGCVRLATSLPATFAFGSAGVKLWGETCP